MPSDRLIAPPKPNRLASDGHPTAPDGDQVRDQGEATPPPEGDAGGVTRRQMSTAADLVCSPPVPIDDLALAVAPIEAERYANDPDICGHYFFPYELAEEINARYGGFEVSDMDVRWHRSAYAANAADFAHLNYTLLRHDTYVQRHVHKSTPLMTMGDVNHGSQS